MRVSFSTNIIMLQGNVCNDPEVKMTANDTFILKFSLATNRSVKVGEEYEDRATFHRIICIGKGAQWLQDKIKKGHKVMVIGRQENRSYETESGEKRYVSEVIADTVTPFLVTNSQKPQKKEEEREQDIADVVAEVVADDIPF